MAGPTPVLPAAPASPAAALAGGGAIPTAGTVIQDCADCPELLAIPAGEFVMGSGPKDKMRELDEEPAHRVKVAASIAVGKLKSPALSMRPLPRRLAGSQSLAATLPAADFSTRTPKRLGRTLDSNRKNEEPVVCVSWHDAQAYVAWLSKKSLKQYRLLNEAEWEYAARAGSTGRRHWADAEDSATCRFASVADTSYKSVSPGAPLFPCSDGFAYTTPVGRFPANAFGLHDMLGNVGMGRGLLERRVCRCA
jgi:sulfatase modifying factor 1